MNFYSDIPNRLHYETKMKLFDDNLQLDSRNVCKTQSSKKIADGNKNWKLKKTETKVKYLEKEWQY